MYFVPEHINLLISFTSVKVFALWINKNFTRQIGWSSKMLLRLGGDFFNLPDMIQSRSVTQRFIATNRADSITRDFSNAFKT